MRELGRGGMGVVYAAHDDRLDRPVAIKVIRPEALADSVARERFGKEARAAARVSHPHICPLYEFDEADGQPFLVMELLEGEPLSARLERGPMSVADALEVAQPMLDALAALHRRGIVHRDLKPANVFLTPNGVKLLDFGLARPLATDAQTNEIALTHPGIMVGTPQYMAPEQLLGGRVDERVDIFAAGAVLYEMLAGRPAFSGRTLTEILHAVGYEDPPPLGLPPEMGSLESVIRQALAKTPADRPPRADVLAATLRAAEDTPRPASVPERRRPLRFVALPLRVLRPDPETDFLAFSIPDAVSVSLATLESVLVRSPLAATSAHAGRDLRAVARELAVDVVLTGTILRAGAHVRVSAQLADASGTLIWSDTAQAPIADLFQLQDGLTERIVSSLSLPLSARDRRSLDRDAPASAEAYELYLRANELMTDSGQWDVARELYERAVALDAHYAPAWARLGRARRVLAKYGGPSSTGLLAEAEAAFRRALDLNPDLSIAHDLAAYVEAELGRAPEAMQRLLRRAATRRSDPGLMAGLVTTCRYAGLLDASLAAHRRAVTIDPTVQTSITWTYMLKGELDEAIRSDRGNPPYSALISRAMKGDDTVLGAIDRHEAAAGSPGTRLTLAGHRAAIAGDVEETLAMIGQLRATGFADPEGWYLSASLLARCGATRPSLDLLAHAIDGGYACHEPLLERPMWAPFRGLPDFEAMLARTSAMVARARELFDLAEGATVLAPRAPASSRVLDA